MPYPQGAPVNEQLPDDTPARLSIDPAQLTDPGELRGGHAMAVGAVLPKPIPPDAPEPAQAPEDDKDPAAES